MSKLTMSEKLSLISEKIRIISPEKVSGEITLETSLTNEISLDSIEIMDLLISIQEEMKKQDVNRNESNIDKLLSYLFTENDDLTVQSLCEFMDKL